MYIVKHQVLYKQLTIERGNCCFLFFVCKMCVYGSKDVMHDFPPLFYPISPMILPVQIQLTGVSLYTGCTPAVESSIRIASNHLPRFVGVGKQMCTPVALS